MLHIEESLRSNPGVFDGIKICLSPKLRKQIPEKYHVKDSDTGLTILDKELFVEEVVNGVPEINSMDELISTFNLNDPDNEVRERFVFNSDTGWERMDNV